MDLELYLTWAWAVEEGKNKLVNKVWDRWRHSLGLLTALWSGVDSWDDGEQELEERIISVNNKSKRTIYAQHFQWFGDDVSKHIENGHDEGIWIVMCLMRRRRGRQKVHMAEPRNRNLRTCWQWTKRLDKITWKHVPRQMMCWQGYAAFNSLRPSHCLGNARSGGHQGLSAQRSGGNAWRTWWCVKMFQRSIKRAKLEGHVITWPELIQFQSSPKVRPDHIS